MKKNLIIFFISAIVINLAEASTKNEIILNLKKTNNLTFKFNQKINNKTDKGNCIIEYPKKIYCAYNNFNKKILVSNGKSLVVKNLNNSQYYIYPITKTPLNFILDKNYLINNLEKLNSRIIDDKYINFSLINEDIKINIFFDKTTYELTGWQTEDVYNNLVITFISDVKINQKYDKSIFRLPEIN